MIIFLVLFLDFIVHTILRLIFRPILRPILRPPKASLLEIWRTKDESAEFVSVPGGVLYNPALVSMIHFVNFCDLLVIINKKTFCNESLENRLKECDLKDYLV